MELVKTTAILGFMFAAKNMSLFGLTLSADSVYGDILVNFAILGIVDAIANVILSFGAKYFERQTLNLASFLALGGSCLIVGFIRLFAPEQKAVSGSRILAFEYEL